MEEMTEPGEDEGVLVARNNQDEHVLTKVPEMISKILSYLLKPDLLSCTMVNHRWEGEARKHLLNQVTVRLDPQNLIEYVNVMDVRENCHSSIHLKFPSIGHEQVANLEKNDYFPLLKTFAEKNASKVRHLSTDWQLHGEIRAQYFQVWSLFTSLISLELRPFVNQSPSEVDEKMTNLLIDNLIPPKTTFPTVKNLSIKVRKGDEEAKTILRIAGFASRILSMFPNMTALKLWNDWEPFLQSIKNEDENDSDLVHRLTSLSLLAQDASHTEDPELRPPLDLPPLVNLTHLEFNFKFYFRLQQHQAEGDEWGRILEKCAPTLTHLTIRHVRNSGQTIDTDGPFSPLVLVLPVMPKLKKMEIRRSPHVIKWYGEDVFPESIHPSLQLEFSLFDELEDEDETEERPLLPVDYPRQFPSLTHLAIVKEMEPRFLRNNDGDQQEPLDDEFFFETSVPFLCRSFLVANPDPTLASATLTDFNIIWPEGDEEFKFLSGPECKCFDNCAFEMYSCNCWKWTELNVFYERVYQNFPNVVNNHDTKLRMEPYKEQKRKEKVKKFVELGKNLGFLASGGWVIDKLPL